MSSTSETVKIKQELQAISEKIAEIEAEGIWDDPIVTQLEPLGEFYAAEDYHQNYYARNGNNPYCQAIIAPKVAKLRKLYQAKLKSV